MTDSITEVGVVSDFFRIEDLSPLIVASAVCSQTPFLARIQELWRLVLLRAGWDGLGETNLKVRIGKTICQAELGLFDLPARPRQSYPFSNSDSFCGATP
jgi:hypothetical protein